MADLKISQLTAISVLTPATDVLPVVDVGGVTKKITTNQILASGGVASLASATITGALTVDTTTLVVNPSGYADRVGIGTATPAYNLDVIGSASIGGTGSAFTRFTSNGGLTTLGVGAYVSVQGSGNPATGSGIEINGGATPFILAYNRDGSAYLPLTIDGSSVLFKTSGSEKARIDASGNVGLGITPSAWASMYRGIQMRESYAAIFSDNGNGVCEITSNAYNDGAWKYANATKAARYQLDAVNGQHEWYTAGTGTVGGTITDFATAKMTLDGSGNLYLKTTSRLSSGVFSVAYVPGTSQGAVFQPNSDVSSPTPIQFLNSSGSGVGSITTTASATAYNISSDYRLKEAVQPLSSGLARVSALKPSIYKWKMDGSSGEGFLAHELADVVPFAVTGEKDAVDADGKPAYQGVDLSKLVPILVAAIQELTDRVQTLEAK